MSEDSEFVSLGEIADRLGASKVATRSWLEADGITAFVFGSGPNAAIRYRRDEVDEWIEESAEDDDDEEDAEDDGDEGEESEDEDEEESEDENEDDDLEE